MDTIIRMEHVSKSYQLGLKSIQALKDLDFTAERGEFVAVMGRSGSGKFRNSADRRKRDSDTFYTGAV